MKITLKLQDHPPSPSPAPPPSSPPLLLRAKVPIEVFNLPFLSHFSATTAHPSDLSLSLSTNFSSGPSLKLSYSTATAAATIPPLTLTLKSGTGLFGSPINSPLIISANFSFAQSNPSFSLLLKPQFGSFSLRKSIHSNTDPIAAAAGEDSGTDSPNSTSSSGFVPVEGPAVVQQLEKPQNPNPNPNAIFKGIQMSAFTRMPVAKSVDLNLRWWMNFAEDQMPVLRINKIGIQRINKAAPIEDKTNSNSNPNELQMVKGMCFWMKRELDVLTRVNRDIKGELEEIKSRSLGFREDETRKKVTPMSTPVPGNGNGPSTGFEQWRRKRRGGSEESGKTNVVKKDESSEGCGSTFDVENELERAIKAATLGQ